LLNVMHWDWGDCVVQLRTIGHWIVVVPRTNPLARIMLHVPHWDWKERVVPLEMAYTSIVVNQYLMSVLNRVCVPKLRPRSIHPNANSIPNVKIWSVNVVRLPTASHWNVVVCQSKNNVSPMTNAQNLDSKEHVVQPLMACTSIVANLFRTTAKTIPILVL
jgi:hypothetical protein